MNLESTLITLVKKSNITFTFKNNTISHKDVLSKKGLLPGITKQADQLAKLCLNYTLGTTYEEDTTALLGYKVSFDNFTPISLRLFFILDAILDIQQRNGSSSIVPIDEVSQ